MDDSRFDALARSLAAGLPRRRLLLGLVAGLLSSPLGRPRQAAAGCTKPGKKCERNNECCDGARCQGGECRCKGSREACGKDCVKLDTDEKHCGRCDRRCAGNETCRDGRCEGNGNGGEPCRPNCAGKVCGGDGCGGLCGACGPLEICDAGACGCPAGATEVSGRCATRCNEIESPPGAGSCNCIARLGGPDGFFMEADSLNDLCSNRRCASSADCEADELCQTVACVAGLPEGRCGRLCHPPA